MNKIILTAFEPWRRRKKNMSLEVLKNINKRNIPDFKSLIFPTIFDDFKSEIEYIKNFNPDYILSLGESSQKKIEFEKKAKNLIHCIIKGEELPDNKGRLIKNELIIETGPPFYLTTLHYKKISRYVGKKGYKTYESNNVSTHVCNFLFYKLLHEFKNSKTKVGFMHIPHSGNINKLTDLTYLILNYLNKYSGGKEKWEKY